MGVFKKYSPMLASEGLRLYPFSISSGTSDLADRYRTTVCKWYDLDNTEWTELAGVYYSSSPSGGYINPSYAYIRNLHGCYSEMTAYATGDVLEAFDVYDHTINTIGTTTQSTGLTASTNSVERVFAIRIVNNSTEPITVKCIKFKRDLYTVDKGITTNLASKIKGRSSLYCAYFLDEDEWITIANGDSANLVIDFSSVST